MREIHQRKRKIIANILVLLSRELVLDVLELV